MSIMNPSGAAPTVQPVDGFDMRVAKQSWPYAEARRAEIAAHWATAAAQNAALFDGRVLVARELGIAGGVVCATYVEIAFSALLYWRNQGFPPEAGAYNAFGSAVVVARDGAVLVAEMGAHTSNPGRVYFPAGTPDLSDVRGEVMDIDSSILRELAEETGLGGGMVRPGGQRWMVMDRPIVSCARRLDVDLTGDALLAHVRAFLDSEAEPELAGVRLVRSRADIDPQCMPAYVCALLGELVPA